MKTGILILIIFSIGFRSFAQDEAPSKIEMNGYITDMQSVMFSEFNDLWINDNLLHNRLNFFWYPNEKITTTVQLRNRLMWGDRITSDNSLIGYKKGIDFDPGIVDMSANIFDGKSYLFNMAIDRLWFRYESGNFNITLGRQRINWGQNFVWNTNDLFNTYSFFDFDYEEKPGSDAIRLQYYPSMTSTVEVAAKINHDEKVTAAALFRFSKWDYDFQFIGGLLNETDYVVGGGWTGSIKNAAFSGEISYFQPTDSDLDGVVNMSIGTNYSFDNSLMLMFEYLYSSNVNSDIDNILAFYENDLSAKNMTFDKHNFFAQASYPITPLLNASFAGMVYPKIKGGAIIPSFIYSLKDNLDFTLIAQIFSGEYPDENNKIKRQSFSFGFLKISQSF